MKNIILFVAIILINSLFGQEIIAPCAEISVNQNAGIFTGMGLEDPSTGSITLVSTRPYDSLTIDSTYLSKSSGGSRGTNPLNAIIYRGDGTRCMNRNKSSQDSVFTWSQVDLSIDRIKRIDSLLADTAFTSHHKFLCFDFSREQKLIQAGKWTMRGRLEGLTTINICECYTEDSEGVRTPCVW